MQRRLATGATSALLISAGALFVVAASQRWWPVCQRGNFDDAACVQRQSHEYDYLFAASPWTPVGSAAELSGVALLLLAAAAALLPFALLRTGRLRIPLAVAVAGGLTVLGAQAVASGRAGHPVALPLSAAAAWIWILGVPLALMVLCASKALQGDKASSTPWSFALAAALTASTPLPVLLLLGPLTAGYSSHDTAPWTEAAMAVPLALAALIIWPAASASKAAPQVTAS